MNIQDRRTHKEQNCEKILDKNTLLLHVQVHSVTDPFALLPLSNFLTL